MFDRFINDSRKAMARSRAEALRLGHGFIGVEHILLGLLQVKPIAGILAKLEIEVADVRRRIEDSVVPGDQFLQEGQIPFTSQARKALELSMEEAEGLSHNFIAPEHLLLGLIREEDGVASNVLHTMGLDPEKVRLFASATYEGKQAKRPWWEFW